MASPILHIKDSFYFELPKSLWPQAFSSKADFTGSLETWLRLDPEFQAWEAVRFHEAYASRGGSQPKAEMLDKYESWKHEHVNDGKPFSRFIAEVPRAEGGDQEWYKDQVAGPSGKQAWHEAIEATSGSKALDAYRATSLDWSREKLNAYSRHLSGKILIPQPFGRLKNLYEKDSGICISRFMLIEVAVALVLWAVFSWLGRNVVEGSRPRGPLWNLLETFVAFVRDQIARPVIGHVKPELAAAESHATSSHSAHGAAEHAHGHADQAHDDHATHDHHHHDPRFDADRFVPLLLTIFFFVLGCNLSGMIPWVGAPTGEWGTTSALALVTFATGIVFGVQRFGFAGYLINQIPSMDLPLWIAVVIKPAIFAIEILGLLIKHAVLSIRLLANMVAGHIVLLSVMGLAFSVQGAASDMWSLSAVISVLGSTLLSCLELFVAFLQAYIFTFLSAMFIGASIHHH